MRKHAKRTLVALIFLFLFLTSAVPAIAKPYFHAVYDELTGKYVGCEISLTGFQKDAKVYNLGEVQCAFLQLNVLQMNTQRLVEPPEGRFDSTLLSVDPRLAEHAQIVLKNQKIEAIDVAAAVAEWDLYDKILVLNSTKAVDVVKNAKVEGASSCTLRGPGGDESEPVIKVTNSTKNRATLKQAGVRYFIFKRSDVAGQLLALGPPSAVRSALDKEGIKFKEAP